MNNLDLNKKSVISFKNKIFQELHKSKAEKIAVLVTNEYEGFSRNGGIGTYYTSLSQHLAQAEWLVILILCQGKEKFGGKSEVAALNYVFSTSEVEDVLNLTSEHKSILHKAQEDFYFKFQSVSSWFYAQAISHTFKDRKVYFEFPEVNGFAYDTVQAKKANLLGNNSLTAITIHGCFEWVFEANESLNKEDWFNQSCYREQNSFENVDLAFFPSYFLKEKIETYGWKTNHAHNRPYFIPILPIKTYIQKQELDSQIVNLLGMTSSKERAYVQEYAEIYYTGEGEIVDLGCWLGSLTVPLAIGLTKNSQLESQKTYAIQAYDQFIWKQWMNEQVKGTSLENKYQNEDSFLDAFLEQIKPWKKRIKVHAEDLKEINWDSHQPIEFLLIDAMKSWNLTNSILHNFFPALIPGLSIIHHQDFCHYYPSWIHLIMYRFKDYFEPMFYVPNGSVVFKYTKAIPPELLEKTYSFSDFSEAEVNQAFDYSLSIVPSEAQANIAAAKVMLYIHSDDLEKAQQELILIKKTKIYSAQSDFAIVEQKINNLID